jgi:Flp pilus assembly protein TadB
LDLGAQSVLVVAAVTLIAFQTLLIVWLLFRRAARRRTRILLEERLRFETLLSELSAGLDSRRGKDMPRDLDRLDLGV